ncbi:MAG: homoserine kinase [Rickettsiales bacterium]|nr:homoserine kinase [Rickettsiales bacterium]
MAVYTRLTAAEINQHLIDNYQIGELVSFKEIVEGIDNSNFIIDTKKGRYILTIFEKRINKEELPFFINFKLHLANNGICCPCPILDNKGGTIVDLKGRKSVIVSFLNGAVLKPEENGYYKNITSKHSFEVGKVLAKLHEAAKGFNMKRENELGVNGFRNLFKKFEHLIDDYQKDLGDEISQIIDFLEVNYRQDLPSAAIHADLFPDNVFFDEKQNVSGVIDFYFAANDLLIYDFAIIVNAWCFDENNNFIEERFSQMMKGYNEVRKFSSSELNFLQISFIAAAMRFLLTRLHDMFFTPKDSLVKVKNPQEYLIKLRYFRAQCQ